VSERLRAVVSTILSEENCALIERLEPRIDLIRDQSLLRPQRHPGDHSGDTSVGRSREDQQRFEELIDSAEVLYGVPDESPAALKRAVNANPGLRWVQTMPAGGGAHVKAAELTQQQLDSIAFTTSAGVHAEPLAEFAVAGVFAGAKQLPRLLQQQRDRQWTGRWTLGLVSEQTVLVVGLGSIGRLTAKKLSALGARVVGVHRRIIEVEGVERVYPMELLADVAAEADAIVLCLPGTDATFEVVDDSVFSRMRPGATIINVGRGTVVDEASMIRALTDGRLGFAMLDVFAVEPLPASSPLWSLSNVVIAPHTAALNSAEDRSIAKLFAENARLFLDCKPMINRVNTVEFY